jgi:hypothetical protein
MQVISWTAAMNVAEEELCSALVACVGGSRLTSSPTQVAAYLLQHHGIAEGDVQVHRYKVGSFLITFRGDRMADQVLHASLPSRDESILIFGRYHR